MLMGRYLLKVFFLPELGLTESSGNYVIQAVFLGRAGHKLSKVKFFLQSSTVPQKRNVFKKSISYAADGAK